MSRFGRAVVFGAVSVAGAFGVVAASSSATIAAPSRYNADGSLSDLGPVPGLPAGIAAT